MISEKQKTLIAHNLKRARVTREAAERFGRPAPEDVRRERAAISDLDLDNRGIMAPQVGKAHSATWITDLYGEESHTK